MADVPTKFEFEHLMSHTFPGFFSAITLFMLIDILSPLNLTALTIKDITSLGSFVGFVLLIGSILGVIADGIYHSIIEDDLFDKLPEIQKYKIKTKKKCFADINEDDKIYYVRNFSHYYFTKQLSGEMLLKINTELIKSYYCYARFYSNTFLALIPFSIIVPFYLLKTLQIKWIFCIIIGFVSLIFAFLCLYSGYVAYKTYNRALFSAIFGYTRDSREDSGSTEKKMSGKIKISRAKIRLSRAICNFDLFVEVKK